MSGEKENKINLLMKDFSALNEILYGCSYATIMKSPLIGKNKKISFIWKCHKCGMYFSNSIENRFDKGHGCPNCTSGGNTRKFERSFENLKPLIFEKCQIKDLNIGQLVKSGKTSHIIDWEWLKNRGVNSPKRVKAKCFSDGCKNLLLTKKRGLNKEVCQIIKHPYCLECSGQKASPEDNLTLYPEYLDIVDNWNYELTPFGPEECLPQSNVRVWLHCPRCGQEYPIDLPKATKLNRRHSCGKKRSLIQLRVFSEIVSMLPNYKVEMEADVLGHEVDVYFPDAKLGIEIDGPHHKSRIENDKRKTEDLAASNVHLVRIRDISLDCAIGKVSDNFWFDFKKSSKPELLLPVIFEALKKLGLGSHHTDLTFKGNKLFAELIKNRRIKYEESLEHNSPLIAKEIHEDEEVDAKYIHNKSGLSLWFKCWNPNHPPYFMQVSDRTDQGLGCFYCSGQKVLESESAGALFPVLLEQIVDDVDLFAYTPFSNRGEEEPKSTKKNSLTWHCGNKGIVPLRKRSMKEAWAFLYVKDTQNGKERTVASYGLSVQIVEMKKAKYSLKIMKNQALELIGARFILGLKSGD
jgi:very-short-patch-repair endonuclease